MLIGDNGRFNRAAIMRDAHAVSPDALLQVELGPVSCHLVG